jgi:hypothetical protein
MSKKKKPSAPKPLSPIAYLRSGNARKLPIHECLIPEDWSTLKKFPILVARKHINGNITAANFLVDLYCAGVKSCFCIVNASPNEYNELVQNLNSIPGALKIITCDYILAHNIIFEAYQFAMDYGIDSAPEFTFVKLVLEEDTDDIPVMEIPLGEDNKPLLFYSKHDPKSNYYLKQLDKYAGRENFTLIYDDQDEESFDEGEDEFLDDGYDEDEYPEYWTSAQWKEMLRHDPEYYYLGDEELDVFYARCIYYPLVNKKVQETPNFLILEEIEINFDRLINDFTEEELSKQEKYFHKLRKTKTIKKVLKLVDELRREINQNPNNYILYNYLFNAYLLANLKEEAELVMNETLEKFPDYLFGKITYCHHLLSKGEAQKIPAVFGGETLLTKAVPNRKTFHHSEYITFQALMGLYYLEIGNTHEAFLYYYSLRIQFALLESEVANSFIDKIQKIILEEVRKIAGEAQKDSKKMSEILNYLVNVEN